MKYNQSGVKDYSLETLLNIKRDYAKRTGRMTDWETERIEAVKKEIERRMKP